MDIQKDKIPLNKYSHAVRASQCAMQYGVGSLIDFPDQTLMTAAPEYWGDAIQQIHDERLQKILHVEYLGMLGNSEDNNSRVAYVRFPEWYFCPKCRRFQPISEWVAEYRKTRAEKAAFDPHMIKHMRCPRCSQDLVVTRIVTACENGHIDDFPWVKWVHCRNIGGPKPVCREPHLTFRQGAGNSEGMDDLVIHCSCGCRATLRNAFDPDIFRELDKKYAGEYHFSCSGRHPWKHSHEACTLYPKTIQRGSSTSYFPVKISSLVIPPYSNLLTTKIESSKAFAECKTAISSLVSVVSEEMRPAIIASLLQQNCEKIALEVSAPKDKVLAILQRKWMSADEENQSTGGVKYRAEEYDALKGAIVCETDDYGDFVREDTDIAQYGLPFLKGISLIHKIREVQALTGFTRLKPPEKNEISDQSDIQASNIVCIKEKETKWYPAYQVRGEGIFIEFDEAQIHAWAEANPEVISRAEQLTENYKKTFYGAAKPRTVTPKFLLLHTVSHLLIKQMSFECGYNIASLKERLYCSEKEDGAEMAGILIYTASGDAEGTLGGLVRQGRPDVFPSVFAKAIRAAAFCSNDPVCSLSSGQGRDSLNLAACYSCSLIPETSCEEFNTLLDRGVVVGTFEDSSFGFFPAGYIHSCRRAVSEAAPPDTLPIAAVPDKLPEKYLKFQNGSNMSTVSWKEIWQLLSESAYSPEEAALWEKAAAGDLFAGKEKPYFQSSFTANGGEEMDCALYWKRSKTVLFTSEDEDEFTAACDSDYRCFYSMSDDFSLEALSQSLKEE